MKISSKLVLQVLRNQDSKAGYRKNERQDKWENKYRPTLRSGEFAVLMFANFANFADLPWKIKDFLHWLVYLRFIIRQT